MSRQLPLCEGIILPTVLLRSGCSLSSSTVGSFNPSVPGMAACASAGCRFSLRRWDRSGRGMGEVGINVGRLPQCPLQSQPGKHRAAVPCFTAYRRDGNPRGKAGDEHRQHVNLSLIKHRHCQPLSE